jgi:hypothetical protein
MNKKNKKPIDFQNSLEKKYDDYSKQLKITYRILKLLNKIKKKSK